MIRSGLRMVVALMLVGIAPNTLAGDDWARHGVILVYHHVSEHTPDSTSVTPATFESHLDYLDKNGYRVWPLQRLLDAVLNGSEAVPQRVVSITFDDAYESVYTEARPRLEARDWPYTVFVNTDAIDAGHSPYMAWDQLRALGEAGVAIENHSAAHGHMAEPAPGESRDAWRNRVATDIERARSRIAEEIGRAPTIFAYPYGEDSPALADIAARDHAFALAQRSGPVGPMTNALSVPRFPMATGFDSLDRLELALRTRPLPVTALETRSCTEGGQGCLERIDFEVNATGFQAGQLDCFAASGRNLEVKIDQTSPDDEALHSVRVIVSGIGAPGRNKINCTAPAGDGSGDYYWFSYQWLVDEPHSSG